MTNLPQMRRLFDAKAATWLTQYALHDRLASRRTFFATAVTHDVTRGRAAPDLGCGTGKPARALVATGRRATECDIAGKMLSRAAGADLSMGSAGSSLIRSGDIFRSHQLSLTLSSQRASLNMSIIQERSCASAPACCTEGSSSCAPCPDLTHSIGWLEWLVGAPGRLSLVRPTRLRWLRLDAHLNYLTSPSRHSARWWHAAQAVWAPLSGPRTQPGAGRCVRSPSNNLMR